MFSSAQGFATGKVYYAQIIGFWTGLFWNCEIVTASPAYALTVMTVVEPNSWGVFGIGIPELLPSGVYKIIFRQRATAVADVSDNIMYEEHIEKSSIDSKIKFLEMHNICG